MKIRILHTTDSVGYTAARLGGKNDQRGSNELLLYTIASCTSQHAWLRTAKHMGMISFLGEVENCMCREKKKKKTYLFRTYKGRQGSDDEAKSKNNSKRIPLQLERSANVT